MERPRVDRRITVDYGELSDSNVIELAQEGREPAFRELVRRYERPIFSLIYRLVGDRATTEDLSQESFVKVFNALDRYDPSYKFSSWIFKIAHNTALDHLRKKELDTISLHGSPDARDEEEARATSPRVASDEESPEQYAASRELGRELERAIAELRPEYRTAIVLWHVEGHPYEEIAEIMDLPLGTVKTYMHRARKALRQKLAHLRA
ncbi:MAG: RNA polymerase sigma factor [Gemmatimonadota bacterium]